MTSLKDFYENDSTRFWNPLEGMIGRDLHLAEIISSFGSGHTVLEYGPGSGSLLLNLYKQNIASSITAYDISDQVISTLTENFYSINKFPSEPISPRFYVTSNDVMHSTDDSSIDVGICADTLEHVLDPFIVLKEFYRVIRPGGLLLLSVPNYSYVRHLLKLIQGRQPITGGKSSVSQWIDHGWDGMHLHPFTYESLTTALASTGFRIDSVIGDSSKKGLISHLQKRYPTLLSGTLTATAIR